MNFNHRFVPIINLLFALVLLLFQRQASIACEKISEPEVKRIQVAGADEFARQVDPYLKMDGKKALIFDLHGVLMRYSEPPSHECPPRGDMVDFLKYVASGKYPEVEVIVASAWNVFEQTVQQAKFLGLTEILKLDGDVIQGEFKLDADVYEFARLGNLISVRKQEKKEETTTSSETSTPQRKYYFHKACSPLVAYGMDCTFDLMMLIDDSTANVNLFAKTVKCMPYYSKLKTLLLFDIPKIEGKDNPSDHIPSHLLPDEFRSKQFIQNPLDFVIPEQQVKLQLPLFAFSRNPLAMSGFYRADDSDSEDVYEPSVSLSTVSNATPSSSKLSYQPLTSSTVVSVYTESEHSHSSQVNLSKSAEICRLEEDAMLQPPHASGRGQLTKSH